MTAQTFAFDQSQVPHTGYRKDIQGLRALGALLVAVFHIWEAGISGGVDVFFVVSGYFLGLSYAQMLDRGQTLRLSDHLGRFVRRTVPNATIVLVFILLLGFALVSPVYWRPFLQNIVASALYFENYYLIWR